MNHLYIQTRIFDSEPFLHASAQEVGIWLLLYRYCAGQENGGRIHNAQQWSPGTWSRVIGGDKPPSSPLWLWHENDLVLIAYDKANEKLVQRQRAGGRMTAQKRWNINPVGLSPRSAPPLK